MMTLLVLRSQDITALLGNLRQLLIWAQFYPHSVRVEYLNILAIKLIELQQKFDELEAQGVFRRPEDVNVTAEYLNPSFLDKKPN